MTLLTAQVFDVEAGALAARQALGGPRYLSQQGFYFGINDVVSGDYRTSALFNPTVFKLYDAWNTLDRSGVDTGVAEARRAVARGETLFNSKPIMITGVKGLNDDLSVPLLQGTCTTCHDTPHAGNHSIPAPLDIGLTDASRRTPDLPLYTLRHTLPPFETIQTTDPGRAMITGKWKDIGRFRDRSCARWPRVLPTSITVLPRTWPQSSTSTTSGSGSDCPSTRKRTWLPSCRACRSWSPQHLRLARAEKWGR